MEYEYQVTAFKASVSTNDISTGTAPEKVCAQLAGLLEDNTREGWELQGQYRFDVEVKQGCLAALAGRPKDQVTIEQLVFRRPKTGDSTSIT